MAELFDRIIPHQRFQLTFEVNSDICWVLAAFENLGIKVTKTNCELLARNQLRENIQEEIRVKLST